MKIGELYVTLRAGASELAKGFRQATVELEKYARNVKRVANDVAQAGMAMFAIAGAAVALAAKADAGVARQLTDLKNAFTDLAVPVAQMVVPAMKELATWVRLAADVIAGLSPETRAAIAQFILIATVVGGAALVISKLAGAVGALVAIFATVTSGPFLLLVGALAVILALILVIHKAWRENWVGIQGIVKTVATNIGGYFAQTFATMLSLAVNFVRSTADGFILLINLAEVFAAIAGVSNAKLSAMAQFGRDVANWAKNLSTPAGMGELLDEAVVVGETLKNGFLKAAAALKKELGLVGKELGLTGLSGLTGKAVRHGGAVAIPYADMPERAPSAEHARTAARSERSARRGFGGAGLPGAASTEAAAAAAEAKRWAVESSFIGRTKAVLASSAAALGAALAVGVGQFASKLGEAGEVVQAGIAGAQDGGIWGALIAIFFEFLSRVEGFGAIMDIANGQLGQALDILGPALNAILGALEPIMGAIGMIAENLLNALLPILEGLAKVIEAIVPLLVLIAFLFRVLKPIFEVLGAIIGVVADVIKGIVWVILNVVKAVLLGIFHLVKGMGQIWNTIVFAIGNLIYDILKGIDKGAASSLRNAIISMRVDLGGISGTISDLEQLTMESAQTQAEQSAAVAKNTEQQKRAAETAKKVNEQLSNVPTGFKVALARFNATAADVMSAATATAAGPSAAEAATAAAAAADNTPTQGATEKAANAAAKAADAAAAAVAAFVASIAAGGQMVIENMTVVADDPNAFARQAARQAQLQHGNPLAKEGGRR